MNAIGFDHAQSEDCQRAFPHLPNYRVDVNLTRNNPVFNIYTIGLHYAGSATKPVSVGLCCYGRKPTVVNNMNITNILLSQQRVF